MEAHRSTVGKTIRFGSFEVDLEALQLRKAGLRLRVAGQPIEVLAILLERPNAVVTREEFRARLWPSTVVDYEHSLNAAIKKLREALDDCPEQPVYIETIPRRGYRFIAQLEEVPERHINLVTESGAALPLERDPLLTPPGGTNPALPLVPPRRSRWPAAAIAALAIAITVLSLLLTRSRKPTDPRYLRLTNFADSASSPSLSPNGQMLTFLRGKGTFVVQGEVYLKLLPDGEPFQLTHDGLPKMSPVFSPDGSRIAYTVNDRWAWDTWIVPVLGGAPDRWLRNVSGLTWIGEHRLLYSEIDQGIHMNLVTAEESRTDRRALYRPRDGNGMAHHSSVSPDGKWVALVEMDHVGAWLPCRVIPFDGSSEGERIGPASARCTSAAWSPDGRWIYFSADAGGGFHIWRQRFPAGEPEQVTFGATQEEGVAVAPDGKSFITSIGEEQSAVWLRDAQGERQLSSEGYAYVPTLSPDERKVYYLARAAESKEVVSGELWVLDVPSGKSARLFPGVLITRYDLSPSGAEVVFARDDGEGRSSVWIAQLDKDAAPRRLVAGDAFHPLFGSAGSLFFLRKQGQLNHVYRIAPDGSGLAPAIRDPVISLQSISPDGRWIVAWVPARKSDRYGAVEAFPVGGGPAKPICAVCSVSSSFPIVRWSRDQKFFYFASHAVPGMRGGKTFVVPVPAGETFPALPAEGILADEDLRELPGAQTLEQTDISPGSRPAVFAFSRTTTHRNLYRVEAP